MIRKIGKSRGFTLVELMIVVAIVGILAALAIYGVRKYITNAKTAEARNSLGQMSKDASAAYSREGMQGTVLALGVSTAVTNALCTSALQSVPASADGIKGKKYQSDPKEWNDNNNNAVGANLAGWTCLKFSMQDPQYFMYNYKETGDPSTAGSFDAIANGDLNGDGALSTFTFSGRVQASSGSGYVVTLAPTIVEVTPDE